MFVFKFHSIYSEDFNHEVSNQNKDIFLENHVWTGLNAIVLKESTIGENFVIDTGSIVSGKFKNGKQIIACNLAKIIRDNID